MSDQDINNLQKQKPETNSLHEVHQLDKSYYLPEGWAAVPKEKLEEFAAEGILAGAGLEQLVNKLNTDNEHGEEEDRASTPPMDEEEGGVSCADADAEIKRLQTLIRSITQEVQERSFVRAYLLPELQQQLDALRADFESSSEDDSDYFIKGPYQPSVQSQSVFDAGMSQSIPHGNDISARSAEF